MKAASSGSANFILKKQKNEATATIQMNWKSDDGAFFYMRLLTHNDMVTTRNFEQPEDFSIFKWKNSFTASYCVLCFQYCLARLDEEKLFCDMLNSLNGAETICIDDKKYLSAR